MKNIWIIAIIGIALNMVACSKDDEKTTYTVTFDANSGTPIPVAQKVEEGSTATAPANPARTGYVFVYWHLSGATAAYNFQTPVVSNITLYAKWEEEARVEYWQVSWNLNGGTWTAGDNHATEVVKGGTLAEPVAPVKTGNTFEGWYKEAALTNKITFPYDVSAVTSDFTLYAKWVSDGEQGERKMFTSVAALSSWLSGQPDNTADKAYKVGLKNVNLDSGNNWGDLGIAVGKTNSGKYVDLDLQNCTGTSIPDGKREVSNNKVTIYGAFADCDNIVSVLLPKELESIGKYAFYSCDGLVEIVLPEGLKHIGESAFSSCDKITTIDLPGKLETISESAFHGCYALNSVILHEGSTNKTIGKNAFHACENLESVILPKGVKFIGETAFAYSGLKSINIPEGCTIQSKAFIYCENLISVTLPEGVKVINEWFSACKSLKSINIPNSVTSIDQYSFSGCSSLPSVTIPSSVTIIGYQAFYTCSSLAEIIMLPETPPFLGTGALKNTDSNLKIKVPSNSIEAYKAAPGWSSYASRIIANEE